MEGREKEEEEREGGRTVKGRKRKRNGGVKKRKRNGPGSEISPQLKQGCEKRTTSPSEFLEKEKGGT